MDQAKLTNLWFSGYKCLSKKNKWRVTGNITSSSKEETIKKNFIEDTEDDVCKFTDSDFSKAAARVFDKIDNGKAGVLPL